MVWLRDRVRPLVAGVAFMGTACGGGGDVDTAVTPREKVSVAAQPLVETLETPSPVAGRIVPVAGTGNPGASDNADAKLGSMRDPAGLAVDRLNPRVVYIADWGNNSVRRFNTLDGSLSTVVAGRPNLLLNARADALQTGSGIIAWTTVSGDWQPLSRGTQCSNSICGHTYDGTSWFWGGPVADAIATQVVDVSANANIAAGKQKYHFSALLRGNPNDQARVVVEYCDVNACNTGASILATYDSGFQNFSTWTAVSDERLAPTGTKKIRVKLITHATSGGSADAYFDALQLRALRPTGAPASDQDRDLVSPAAVGVLLNGDLLVGGNGLAIANSTGTTFTKVVGTNGYVPPSRVSSISVMADGSAYIADPTHRYLHVRNSFAGKSYYADVTGVANEEPIAVVAKRRDTFNDLVWVAFRSYSKVYLFVCPRLAMSTDTDEVVSCTYDNKSIGAGAGYADDLDGVAGEERFRLVNGLAFGLYDDLLITEDGNSATRRSAGPFTRTLGGGWVGQFDGMFNSPSAAVVIPETRDVLVADRLNNRIQKIACGGASVCSGEPVCPSYSMDDQVECTTDECEVLAIRHTPKANGDSCSDGDVCNGSETCDTAGVCKPGVPLVVDDGRACNADLCSPTGGVSRTILAAGTPCATGSVCSPISYCNGLSDICPSGQPVVVADGNECTIDACTASTGVTHTPASVGSSCSNGTGTCDASANCVPNNLSSLNPGAIDRTLPTPPSVLFDDFLASNGGGQSGSTACVYDTAHTSCALIPAHMALLRGTVADANGTGLAGVTISIYNHP
jgi:hypothetical protein